MSEGKPLDLEESEIKKEFEKLKEIETLSDRKRNWRTIFLKFKEYKQQVFYCYRCGKINIEGNGDCYCKEEAELLKEKRELFLKIKQRIKKACEFYLEWKNKPRQFIEKYPKYEKILIRKCIYYPKNNEINYYNFQEWLFKLAFKDVFEKGEKRK